MFVRYWREIGLAYTAVAGYAGAREQAGGRSRVAWLDGIIGGLEALFDAGDAVRRRRVADQVYRDLVAQQISEDRAILEIKNINARQKGGWLRRMLGG